LCAALVWSGPARAERFDFIAQLDNVSVSYSSILDMIDIGEAVCHTLRDGTPPPVVLGQLQRSEFAPAPRSTSGWRIAGFRLLSVGLDGGVPRDPHLAGDSQGFVCSAWVSAGLCAETHARLAIRRVSQGWLNRQSS